MDVLAVRNNARLAFLFQILPISADYSPQNFALRTARCARNHTAARRLRRTYAAGNMRRFGTYAAPTRRSALAAYASLTAGNSTAPWRHIIGRVTA